MPKNTTGGSGHKAHKNSEGGKERNNRKMVDTLLEDYLDGEKINDIFIGRVLRRMGCGRMEVFFIDNNTHAITMNIPLRGGLKGKGKKSVWVDVDSLVMISETGLCGTTHEIVALLTPAHITKYRKIYPDADERLFMKGSTEVKNVQESIIEFEAEEELDIDAI
jgi:hypothetical protein